MHSEVVEQYTQRIASVQMELDKMRSIMRQENDALQISDRKRFVYVNALKAVDHANDSLGALRQALSGLI